MDILQIPECDLSAINYNPSIDILEKIDQEDFDQLKSLNSLFCIEKILIDSNNFGCLKISEYLIGLKESAKESGYEVTRKNEEEWKFIKMEM